MTTTLETALELHQAGMSVVPVMADGSKRPAGPWKRYQQIRATEQEIREWFSTGNAGLGVVTGKASDSLELLEVEGRAAHQITHLQDLAKTTGLGPLWEKITDGWFELSPSGGYHWFYRLDHPTPGNTKIAQASNRETIAETRGEGGFVVIAPSTGAVHPTGKPWARLKGGPATIPTLTRSERESLHTLFATLDQRASTPVPDQDTLLDQALRNQPTGADYDGIKPGDDYEAKTNWAQILEPHGWTKVFTQGQTTYWKRPGKTDPGFSATTGHAADRDRLYVFSTSTEFQAEQPYTKFGAFALLNHAGDHSAAAKALRAAGHGKPPSIESKTKPQTLTVTTTDKTAGNLALATVHNIKPKAISTTLTDHGNAQLFINQHGHHLKYAPSRGKWLAWDGTRWAWQEDDGQPIQACWETISNIEPENDSQRSHQHKSLSRRALEAMAALARRDNRIRVTSDQLDNEPHHLNTPTGIINLRDGTIEPHSPDRLHTKTTRAHYNPAAKAPLWDKFLHDAFQEQPEVIPYIQALAGYAATGQVTHHILPFLFGSGGNGKSVFLDTIIAILGDYATSAPAGFLMAGREQHETEIARLAGMRVVVCSEVNQTSKFDESKVKLLTGGDTLTARFMRQDHFTFTPTHTLFLMGNHQPGVESGGGESFWRRLRILPFTRTVPPEQRIEGLAQRLIDDEGSGILNWLIAGSINAYQHGLNAPQAVMAPTEMYAEEEDAIARFITDHASLGGGKLVRVATAHMRTTYAAWCRAQGEKELSPQVFGRELRTRFDIGQERSHGKRFYTNVTLLDTDELDEEQQAEHWMDKIDQ